MKLENTLVFLIAPFCVIRCIIAIWTNVYHGPGWTEEIMIEVLIAFFAGTMAAWLYGICVAEALSDHRKFLRAMFLSLLGAIGAYLLYGR